MQSTRPVFTFRNWRLKSGIYDMLARSHVLNVNAFVYTDPSHNRWLMIASTAGGHHLAGRSQWMLTSEGLQPHAQLPLNVTPAYWTRENSAVMAKLHVTVVDIFESLRTPGRIQTLHCHYIICTDSEPWPRGFINHYNPSNARGRKAKEYPERRSRDAVVMALPYDARVTVDIPVHKPLPDIL